MPRRSLAPLASILLLLPAAAASQAPAPRASTLDAATRRRIDAIFHEHDTPHSPGCALGVLQNGRIAYGHGYGMADLERPTHITTATLFDIGSTSKQFAAASIALLAEEHKLSFDDEVRKYIPELPDYGAPLTIDHLMRHTSGLRDYAGLLALAGHRLEEVTTDSQALALIVHQRKLNFPTGTRYSYSNTNFFLLSVIVQRVSGMSLADFARTHIFLPLGMTHTEYRNHFAMLIPNRALGYAPDSTGKGFRISMSNWEQTGDGALHISIDDILHWDENFYHPRVGGAEMVAELQQRGTLTNGDSIGYARGLFVGTYRGLRRIEHGGDWIGYHAAYARFPAQHTAIVVLCNSDGISPGGLGDRVADIVLAKSFTEAKAAKTVAAHDAVAATGLAASAMVGSYLDTATDEVMRVTAAHDSLALGIVGRSFPLVASGPGTYAVPGLPVHVSFATEGGAPAASMRIVIGSSDTSVAVRFSPATPSADDLRAFAGRYASPELGVTWTVADDSGHLAMDNPKSDLMDIAGTLAPAMPDAFTVGSGTLRFTRGADGRVSGMELSASRMRGIHFDRLDH